MHRRDIVRIAQGAGLPEANGFDRKYIPNPQTWLVTYSDEFDFDFFLVRLVMQQALAAIEFEKATPNLLYWPAKRRAGTRAHTYLCGISDTGRCRRHCLSIAQGSEGRGSSRSYKSGSDNCIKMLPAGWNTWLPPLNPKSRSTDARMGGRRLAGQLNVRLLPETLQLMDQHGGKATLTAAARRVLLADARPSATSTPQYLEVCPDRLHSDRVHKNLTRSDNPTCQGAGLAAYKARVQRLRKAAAMRMRQCSVAFDNSTGRVINTLPLKACAVRPTPRAELDARDEAARGNRTQGEPGDFFSKLTKLVQVLCLFESRANCEVDTQGKKKWYKEHFNVRDGMCSAHAACCPCRRCLGCCCGRHNVMDPHKGANYVLCMTLCSMLASHTHRIARP
jgi:hypothetical protein